MWSIGSITLRSRVILAPMAGVSDRATRTIYRPLGAELAWTEMISAEGLVRDDPKTHTLLDIIGEAPPVIVQIFGRVPETMAEAARICAAAGASGVDVNMGCPVNKVIKSGCGSALMRDPERAAAIVAAMVGAVEVPVTAKFRAGFAAGETSAVAFAQTLAEAGAAAVTLHPRTRHQMFAERADWTLIGQVKEAVACAVIGSGDIATPDDAARMREETGCDAVMIGRAAQGNPWLLAACDRRLEGQPPPPPPTLEERCRTLMAHARLAAQLHGEERAMREMRKQVGWYLRGLPGARTVRAGLAQLCTLADMRDLLARALTPMSESGPATRF